MREMVLSRQDELYLLAMELVERYSRSLNTLSWIWGGFTMDIYENQFLREHDDLDYLTLNLHSLIPAWIASFENLGWQAKLLENGDLKLKRTGVKIHLGHVELYGKARWTHNGERGSIWFPEEWLNPNSRTFCGIEVHIVEPEFQYVMLAHPQILNPDWTCRAKDMLARNYFKNLIEAKGIDPRSLLEQARD